VERHCNVEAGMAVGQMDAEWRSGGRSSDAAKAVGSYLWQGNCDIFIVGSNFARGSRKLHATRFEYYYRFYRFGCGAGVVIKWPVSSSFNSCAGNLAVLSRSAAVGLSLFCE